MNAPSPADQFFNFDNTYAKLPDHFYARLSPTPVKEPGLIKLNSNLAVELGLDPDALTEKAAIEIFAGNRLPRGSDPIAMVYAGHQFGNWVPQLGDGRAILLGELTDRNGTRRDIQLKGSGPTPFSRMGDGRAAVGPVLREYIISEAMAALGIPTTRSLAAVTTGEWIFREAALPGAVLTRVAQSHIRVGTFQYFASRQDNDALRLLADHVIARHYPALKDSATPYHDLLQAVMEQQAALVAKWMGVGFIHGVMNTDNMSIAGETIDYGPCAFMDEFHPDTVFSSIDQMGRYSYRNQPRIAQWNLARFAQCLLPLMDDDQDKAIEAAQTAIDSYADIYQPKWLDVMRAKIGLTTAQDGDLELIQGLLGVMSEQKADFTLTFRDLSFASTETPVAQWPVRNQFAQSEAFDAWAQNWMARLQQEPSSDAGRQIAMQEVNPRFIARNHRVEEALSAAQAGDFQPFEKLIAVLAKPYDEQPDNADYASPPMPDEVVQQTFCGT
ncbi:MAG: YdiU family protein [Pseudomonadota bacterium]